MQLNTCNRLVQRQRASFMTKSGSSLHVLRLWQRCRGKRHSVQAYRVDIDVNGRKESLEVGEDQTILEVALEQGLELSHDCKMGVCMTCPAKLVSGRIDQSAGMLDEDVQEKGYALLCVAQPQSDCEICTIEEEELLAEVMQSGALK